MTLGIDVGTTAIKAVLLDESAQVIAEAQSQHDLLSSHPGWAEEAPEDWWRGVRTAVQSVLHERRPKAVGVSGMVPALVLLDVSGRPVRPSIQQNDARATEDIRWFRGCLSDDELFSQTGATWNSQVLPPKIRWVQRHEPGVWSNTRRICGSYEYVTSRLTGAEYAEANWALESAMWDVRRRQWIPGLLDLLQIRAEMLGPVRRSEEIVGTIGGDSSRETGIPAGTPVIAGSGDHVAAALTAGLQHSGDAVLELGGAGNILYAVQTFSPVRELFIDYHSLPGFYLLNGCMAASGSLVKWYRETFAAGRRYADLDREAESVPAGSEGLVLLPYFLGEKTPLHDPEARGTIVGLTLSHSAAHVYRAILEGVAYAFRHHVDVLRAAGHPVKRCFVMDGGARSPLWRQIMASVLGQEVYHLEGGHAGSVYGVAFVAGVAAGLWQWEDLRIRVAGVTEPDRDAARTYEDAYGVYRETYRRLKDLYPRLAARRQSLSGPEAGRPSPDPYP
jgi:xylulokinase